MFHCGESSREPHGPANISAFKEIYQYYMHRKICITTVHSEGEFAPLQALVAPLLGGTMINPESANEHVPEIKRKIRVVKERCCAARHGLPFQQILKWSTIHIVFQTVKLLNFFPTKGGISYTLSLKTIMSGEILDLKKKLSLHIGQCCQVHEEDAPHNIQNPRTKGAILLGPSGNL